MLLHSRRRQYSRNRIVFLTSSSSSIVFEHGIKLVASLGTILIMPCTHAPAAAQAPHPLHFSVSIMTSPSAIFIAPNLQNATQDPHPTQPSLQSPLTKPISTASSQDLRPANRSLPAAFPLRRQRKPTKSFCLFCFSSQSFCDCIYRRLITGRAQRNTFTCRNRFGTFCTGCFSRAPPRPKQSPPGRSERIFAFITNSSFAYLFY